MKPTKKEEQRANSSNSKKAGPIKTGTFAVENKSANAKNPSNKTGSIHSRKTQK